MNSYLESAYEELGFIACGILTGEWKNEAVRKMRMSLGSASESLDNMIYERLGLSAEEAFDLIDMDATLF